MTTLLILFLALIALDVAVLAGWGHDSRDGRDWRPRNGERDDRRRRTDADGQPGRAAATAATLGAWMSSSVLSGRTNSTRSAH